MTLPAPFAGNEQLYYSTVCYNILNKIPRGKKFIIITYFAALKSDYYGHIIAGNDLTEGEGEMEALKESIKEEVDSITDPRVLELILRTIKNMKKDG